MKILGVASLEQLTYCYCWMEKAWRLQPHRDAVVMSPAEETELSHYYLMQTPRLPKIHSKQVDGMVLAMLRYHRGLSEAWDTSRHYFSVC